MPTPVIIWKVYETLLWRPCSSSQFLLQDASWMSMCFGCYGTVWTESLSIVGTQQSSSMFANQPTQSWCEGDRSDQRLHLAIFSLIKTTTFRGTHDSEGCMKFSQKQWKQYWQYAFGFGPIKCTWICGFLIPASALMTLSYIHEARGQVGALQKICSRDSIGNWSHWEPSVAFAGRSKNGDAFVLQKFKSYNSTSRSHHFEFPLSDHQSPSEAERYGPQCKPAKEEGALLKGTIWHGVKGAEYLCLLCIARHVCKAHSIYSKRFFITITVYSRVVKS